MSQPTQADPIRGRTIRLIWTEGPTKGMTHEHVFHEDGTVEWGAKERVPYRALKAGDDVHLVSYLATSGYTLTVALNVRDRTMVGFASNAKEWHPLRGTFEVVGR